MEFEDLLSFTRQEHQRLLNYYEVEDYKKANYRFLVKIMEELGELSDQILAKNSYQRKEKLNNNRSELNKELTDVLLTTMILAENLDINLEQSLKERIKEIKNRDY